MKRFFISALLCSSIGLACISVAQSAVVSISVLDSQGLPVEDAVIEVELVEEIEDSDKYSLVQADPLIHEVSQRNRTFIPFVSAIKVGSEVDFPNYDKTRHHVYSFSKAKPFELKLYAGRPSSPILFDKPGIVAIGCNIHDYMQAYIYVGNSDWLAVTTLDNPVEFNLPDGNYSVNVWHPWQLRPASLKTLTIRQGEVVVNNQNKAGSSINFDLEIEQKQKPAPPESSLQDLFSGEQ